MSDVPSTFFVFPSSSLNHHVYNGCGDSNISFTFKALHLFVFFLLLLAFKKGKSVVGFST
jgi:hypothetical protein